MDSIPADTLGVLGTSGLPHSQELVVGMCARPLVERGSLQNKISPFRPIGISRGVKLGEIPGTQELAGKHPFWWPPRGNRTAA